jgi:hypothetical protein
VTTTTSSDRPTFNASDLGLGPKSIAVVTRYLASDKDMFCYANFNGNPIGDAGAEAIAAMMEQNETITSLDLMGCEIE